VTNETKRFSNGSFTFKTNEGWESLFLVSDKTLELVTVATADLAEKIIKAAPRGPHVRTDAYSIKKNIGALVEEIDGEYVGFVTVEENPQARHALLQEEGWTDRAGNRHAGRFFIKGVLEGERIE
jgi:hypothetical protein